MNRLIALKEKCGRVRSSAILVMVGLSMLLLPWLHSICQARGFCKNQDEVTSEERFGEIGFRGISETSRDRVIWHPERDEVIAQPSICMISKRYH